MLPIDLHTHTSRSDGTLAPAELVRRAYERGVRVLAVTDHDDLSGIEEATEAGRELGVRVLAGVEISVTWHAVTLHVVGLDVDPFVPELIRGLETVRSGRLERARRIAERLEAAGAKSPLQAALRHAGNVAMIGRTHFARALVEQGVARDLSSAFRRFLAEGRAGYVRHRWAELADAVRWITGAGGLAVLAHPARYDLRPARMSALLDEFVALGGAGLEVVSGSHNLDEQALFARLSVQHSLAAAVGSDFHAPTDGWHDVGKLGTLPTGCVPIWHGRPHWGLA